METTPTQTTQAPQSLEEFKAYVDREGWPAEIARNDKCPRCKTDFPDDGRLPEAGLQHWNPSPEDNGGSGWMCVKCDHCGHHYALDISC